MGWKCPPAYGKNTDKYKKRIEKIDKKIEALKEEKKYYEEIIGQDDNEYSQD